MTRTAWEAIFMLGVLKIPMIYLGVVVWWAVRAEPEAPGGGDDALVPASLTPCGWDDWKRRRPRALGRPPIRPSGGRIAVRAHA